jgi:hypothetical protein
VYDQCHNNTQIIIIFRKSGSVEQRAKRKESADLEVQSTEIRLLFNNLSKLRGVNVLTVRLSIMKS